MSETTCERCRRPKWRPGEPRDRRVCLSQGEPGISDECDRLLLVRAEAAEARALSLERERNHLAVAGDVLADALESLAVISARSGGKQALADAWTAWRDLRSSKEPRS